MSNFSMVNAAASICVIIGALCGGYSTVLYYIDERNVLKATNKTICDKQDEMKAKQDEMKAEIKANKDEIKADINGLKAEIKANKDEMKAEINGLKTAVETSMHSHSRDIMALSRSNQFQFTSFAGLSILVAIFAATRK